MVAFLFTIVLFVAMVGVVVAVAKRRQPGTPLSWGEAFVASVYVFALLFVAYGVVPHHWLAWADNDLGWRSDKIGLPLGPFGKPFDLKDNVLWPNGIPLPNGVFIVTAQVLRDIIAAGIYGVMLGGNFAAWLMWQKRGTKRKATPALETSAYGRPLVRQT